MVSAIIFFNKKVFWELFFSWCTFVFHASTDSVEMYSFWRISLREMQIGRTKLGCSKIKAISKWLNQFRLLVFFPNKFEIKTKMSSEFIFGTKIGCNFICFSCVFLMATLVDFWLEFFRMTIFSHPFLLTFLFLSNLYQLNIWKFILILNLVVRQFYPPTNSLDLVIDAAHLHSLFASHGFLKPPSFALARSLFAGIIHHCVVRFAWSVSIKL